MTALPATASFTGSTVTEAQFKAALTDLRAYLAGLHGADGTRGTALATAGSLMAGYAAKTVSYPVVAADRGRLINCTGSITVTTPAAATVGAGFAFGVKNSGVGTVTIDGNAAELVDGAATVALAPGESSLVVCTGSAWLTVGRTVSLADGSVTTAKLASRVATEASVKAIGQSLTTSYAAYMTDTIDIVSGDAVLVFGAVTFGLSADFAPGNFSRQIDAQLLIGGQSIAAVGQSVTFGPANPATLSLSLAGRVTGLSAGARIATVNVRASSTADSIQTVLSGSLILIKEPT